MLMKKIENPKEYEIVDLDGVSKSTVYSGGLDNLKKPILVWRKIECEEIGEYLVLTLDEIRNQMQGSFLITIFIESPLHGEILQYGNYGDSWYLIGKTCGYA